VRLSIVCEGHPTGDLRTLASLLRHSCKLLQVDISGPWCTISRTSRFELSFTMVTLPESQMIMLVNLSMSLRFMNMTVPRFHDGSLVARLNRGHSSTISMRLSHLVSCLAEPIAHFRGASLIPARLTAR